MVTSPASRVSVTATEWIEATSSAAAVSGGEDRRQPFGQHRPVSPHRSEQRRVMPARLADLECLPRLALPEDVRQLWLRLGRDRTIAAAGAGQLLVRGRVAAQPVGDLGEAVCRDHGHAGR